MPFLFIWRAQSKNDPLIFQPFLKVFRSSWQLLLKTFKNTGYCVMPFLFICEWFNLISFWFIFVCQIFMMMAIYFTECPSPTPPTPHSSTSCTNHFSAEIVYFNLFCIFCSRKKRKKVWQQWKSFFVRKRIKELSPKSALLLIQATSCGNWSMTSHPCCSKFPSQS